MRVWCRFLSGRNRTGRTVNTVYGIMSPHSWHVIRACPAFHAAVRRWARSVVRASEQRRARVRRAVRERGCRVSHLVSTCIPRRSRAHPASESMHASGSQSERPCAFPAGLFLKRTMRCPSPYPPLRSGLTHLAHDEARAAFAKRGVGLRERDFFRKQCLRRVLGASAPVSDRRASPCGQD